MTTELPIKEPKTVQVLDRALKILSLIASKPQSLSLHDIAVCTGLHPSTVHRLLWNLSDHGYAERDQNGCWRLGFKYLEYGHLVRDRLDVREKALPLMQVLHEKTGETINLSIRRGDFMMYIEHVYAPQTGVRLARQVGAMAPLHCTSGGKLFLSEMSPEEISDYITRTKLQSRTENSITTAEKLIVTLGRIRDLGWADDIEELEPGIQCIGAPIRNGQGRIIAAITIISASSMQRKPEWTRHLLSASAAVSASMGWLGTRG